MSLISEPEPIGLAATTGALPEHKPRVILLTEDSKPATGGIAEYLHQLALALSATHEVVIVTSVAGAEGQNPRLPFRYREVPWFRSQSPMRGDDLSWVRRANTWRWHASERRRVRRMLRALLQTYPGATVVLGRVSHVTVPWLTACRALGVSCLAFAYGRELTEEGVPGAARQVVSHWFPISEATARLLESSGIDRRDMTVLLPGIAPRSAVASASQSGRAGTRYLLSIAMLRPRKGIDLAIRAFADVASEFPDLRYVIVGDGPERERLERLAHSSGVGARVEFRGEVDDATRDALLHSCALFVLPTRDVPGDMEGFGLVFLEAAHAGKAAIGGRTGGVVEAIVDGTTGVLVDTDAGIEMLTQTIRHLLRDHETTVRLGRQARRRAIRHFNWGARAQTFAMTMQLARQGRLRAYLSEGERAHSSGEGRDAIVGWITRAMGDGRRGAPAGYHVTGGWDKPYPEVTGYLIPTLLREAACRSDDALAAIARMSGAWLVETRLPSGAVCRKQWDPSNLTPSVFNTAQVLEGWSALARETADDQWLAPARDAAEWLLREQEANGSWVRSAFNGMAHSYYARAAAVLVEFGLMIEEDRYVEAGRRALTWVLGQQRADGWFDHADFTEDDAPTTHTIGYVLEGLLRGKQALGEPMFQEAAEVAAQALRQARTAGGVLPGRFIQGWQGVSRSRCITGEAQVGIVWAMLGEMTGDTSWCAAARTMADDVLRAVRIVPTWPEISGGVPGSVPAWGDYDPYRYPVHAAKFAVDLLARVAS